MYLFILNSLFFLRFVVGRKANTNRIAYWCVLIGLFLFSAFRFRVGCDWSGYYNNYLLGSQIDYRTAFDLDEPMWWVIQVTFNLWELPYPSVNILTSALFFFGIHALARRQPDRLGFLVLLFPILIINIPMSGIRQAAAIGFLCLSFIAFLDARPIRFIGWILFGSTFHSSILVFLLLAPLTTGQYTWRRIIAAAILALPGIYFLLQSENVQIAVSRYVDSGLDAYGGIFRAGILAVTGVFYFGLMRRKWAKQFPADYGLATTGAWMMIAVLPAVGISSVIADRLGYYFIPIQAMIFSRIPYLKGLPNKSILTAIPYIGLILVFAVWSLNSYHFRQCYTPYQSWLFGHHEFTGIGF